MNTSPLFTTDAFKTIEERIKQLINAQADFLSARTITSPRATGDALQDLLAEHFQEILGEFSTEYSAAFARRAMADLAFKDADGFYYVVDVKTHRREAGFHMPNLTSVERLARFYEDETNYFVILNVSYATEDARIVAEEVHFVPIEFLSWECLTLGALGWGQIQIANANRIVVAKNTSRRRWMLQFCDALDEFYPREISKIGKRLEHFQKVRAFWESKPEN